MANLHLTSFPVDVGELRRWAAARGFGDEGRALHHLLSETFGKGALQPFRLMVAPGAARGSIYAYTTTGGEELKRVARECAMPDALVVVDLDRMATKEMPFQWKKGRRLSFDVRVRPVKRISKDGYFRAGAEVDAYLAEAQQRHPEGPSKADPIIREDVYRRWLHERFGDSAKVDAAKMVTCERRKSHLGAKSSEGPDVVWHGDLTVQDGEVFAAKLASGVGRHSAFGYGMLLLRPAA